MFTNSIEKYFSGSRDISNKQHRQVSKISWIWIWSVKIHGPIKKSTKKMSNQNILYSPNPYPMLPKSLLKPNPNPAQTVSWFLALTLPKPLSGPLSNPLPQPFAAPIAQTLPWTLAEPLPESYPNPWPNPCLNPAQTLARTLPCIFT